MSLNLIDQAAQRKRIDDLLANPVESAKELEQFRLKLASRDAETASLRQQLAAALAAIEVKDAALGYRIDHQKVIEALAATDDLVTELRILSGSRKPYPSGAHGQMVGMETYRIVASGFALACIDEASDEIESLRQQLAAMTLERDEWKEAHDVVVANCKLSDEQHHKDMEGYAAALVACKLKDEALQQLVDDMGEEFSVWASSKRKAIITLAIQPDASALKAWLGEPVGEVKKHTGSLKDMAIIVWAGEQPAEGTKLYAPKGVTK